MDLDLERKLLIKLTGECVFRFLIRFDLSSGKLPLSRECGWTRTASRQNPRRMWVLIDDETTNNERKSCHPSSITENGSAI